MSPTGAGAVPAMKRLTEALAPLEVSCHPVALHAYSRDAHPLAIKSDVDGADPLARPAGVVRPESTADVVRIVNVCREAGIPLVPYGGGSGICGSALATEGGLVLDSKLLSRVIRLDPIARLVTVEAGMMGTELECHLNSRGFTCGHSPQSVGSSTVGGWVAHRGAGVFSTRYGKIDDLVQGLRVVMPSGEVFTTLDLPTSAAGPDLNRLFLGSEGTLGIITEVTLKIFELPAAQEHASWAVPDMAAGIDLGRQVVQSGLRPAVVRLYDPIETAHLFPDLGLPPDRCIVLVQAEGSPELVTLTLRTADAVAATLGAEPLGGVVGEAWRKNRFSTAGLVRTLQTPGRVADALEVVNTYGRLADTYREMTAALHRTALHRGATIETFGHASHFYDTGANLYMIFHAAASDDQSAADLYEELVWQSLEACHQTGGSITHHHGVGITKSRLMGREWGTAGIHLWRSLKTAVDPTSFMNPGDKVVHRELQ